MLRDRASGRSSSGWRELHHAATRLLAEPVRGYAARDAGLRDHRQGKDGNLQVRRRRSEAHGCRAQCFHFEMHGERGRACQETGGQETSATTDAAAAHAAADAAAKIVLPANAGSSDLNHYIYRAVTLRLCATGQ